VVGTPTCTPTTCWTSGEVTVAANLKFARPTTTTADATWGPYEALNLGVAPQDGEGVTLLPAALNLDASTPAGNERQTVGSATKERFGRLRLTNAFGSEMLPLSVPATVQYYNGTNWVINTLDSSSPPAPWAVSPAVPTALLGGTGNTTPSLGAALTSGVASLSASAPGTGNRGYLDLTVTVPDYLKFFWTGATATDPTARVSFGIYKGNNRIIYRREVR
jgi:MSHA biogenesis protein MshQ